MTEFGRRAAFLALLVLTSCGRVPRQSGPMGQDAYVWQRDWTTNVVDSVSAHATAFRRVVVLAGEVSWKQGRPHLTPVPFQLKPATGAGAAANPASGQAPGLALRIGPFSGPFLPDDAVARFLATTVRSILGEARSQGVEPAELQVDFDCAEGRLDGYRVWVERLRREAAPVPLVITALPSWLGRGSFAGLAKSADGFVLQVHSIARPRRAEDHFELCDPAAALRAVETAARINVPFRVALPTYGYLVAFGADGRFLGASAEGPPPQRPADAKLRELSADPAAMARLVSIWTGDRPAAMSGLIWYRLPVAGDRLNWRWTTLASVMAGRVPGARLAAESRGSGRGLFEIQIRNDGDGDHSGRVTVAVRWAGSEAAVVGRDAIRGFAAEARRPGEVLFTNPTCRLPAGDAMPIGWVRLDADLPLTLELLTSHEP